MRKTEIEKKTKCMCSVSEKNQKESNRTDKSISKLSLIYKKYAFQFLRVKIFSSNNISLRI